jgi:DNA polymerase elongation subunit (family B)
MTVATKRKKMFIYYSCVDEKEIEVTSIRMYGLGENNENICIRITNFTPYVYIELPSDVSWNEGNVKSICNKINKMMGNTKPLKQALVYRHKLYGAHLTEDNKRRLFPYLFCSFSSKNDISFLSMKLKKDIGTIVGIGSHIKLKIHEQDASPILQMICAKNINSVGWINFTGIPVNTEDKMTVCDEEYYVKWNDISKFETDHIGNPLVMGFDIEVNSSNPAAMPDAKKANDKIFQISCVFTRDNDGDDVVPEKYLLTLGETDENLLEEATKLLMFRTEAELLIGFTKLVLLKNPNVIVGYNILGFDIPYMIKRQEVCGLGREFTTMGFSRAPAIQRKIKWSSSAYGTQEFEYLDAEGRIFVDLLPLIKRDYKLDNYKLKTVSEYFLKDDTKADLSVSGIFKCYRVGTKKDADGGYSKMAKKAIALCGKYCVQDSVLVVKLMKKIQTWVGLCEMAKTVNCSIFSLYTQGQQIKVFSQVYKYAKDNNIVVEKDGYQTKEDERYVGAHVFPPVPGIYDRVVPFDFSSLYPTTIIAYNIDYSTLVTDDSIPDSKCHVMQWEDHLGCEHDPKVIRRMELSAIIEKEKQEIKALREKRDSKEKTSSKKKDLISMIIEMERKKQERQECIDLINEKTEKLKPLIAERSALVKTIQKNKMCAARNYRFVKEPLGVLPTILQNLLDARKKTRNQIKNYSKTITEENKNEVNMIISVLDKRQLAYKISANSMYGAMGVKKGYLPFMPGAMCTTYKGRCNIEIVAKTIPEKYGGQLVYGDTDSNYIHFPHLKTAQDSWDFAELVASEVSELFPKPIKLDFEAVIYWRFFILTKKRYMYKSCLRDGDVGEKIGKKGVLLARRDSSVFVRNLYEDVIKMVFKHTSKEDILYFILQELNRMFSNSVDYKKFVITKSVGSTENLVPVYVRDEVTKKDCLMMGDYKVPPLPLDEKERKEQIEKKEAVSEQEYYEKCLPSQVQLALKMRQRGHPIQSGTRLEYIITDIHNHTDKQYEKIEDYDYFRKFSHVLTVDFFYYLKVAINSIDEVLNIAFGTKLDFMKQQYVYRYKIRQKVLSDIKQISATKLVFIK